MTNQEKAMLTINKMEDCLKTIQNSKYYNDDEVHSFSLEIGMYLFYYEMCDDINDSLLDSFYAQLNRFRDICDEIGDRNMKQYHKDMDSWYDTIHM